MALPDYFLTEFDWSNRIVWGPSGGASGSAWANVTHAMNLDALAAAAGRCGVYADLGSGAIAEEYLVLAQIETGTAPTAATSVDVYILSSPTTSFFPARATGTDAAYPPSGTLTTAILNAGVPAIAVRAENTGNLLIPAEGKIIRPRGRYVCPVVVNNMNQAIRNQTTDSDNLSRVILVPKKLSIAD